MIVSGKMAVQPTMDPLLADIIDRIMDRTGIDCRSSREDYIIRKVDARIKALGLSGYADYLKRLTLPACADEWDVLIEEITVGETFFWRYPAQWDAMRDLVLPERRARKPGAPIRIWCAGCANGAEPYTLTILLHHMAPHILEGGNIRILATDICGARLAKAEQGVYSAWDMRALPDNLRTECFIGDGSRWRLRDKYKRNIIFRRHNLADSDDEFVEAESEPFDIILCRNVMIYFDAKLIRRLLKRFHLRLSEGGWLLTGHAEPYLEISNVFLPTATPGGMLYRKQGPVSVETFVSKAAIASPSPPARRPRQPVLRPVAPLRASARLVASQENATTSLEDARRLSNQGKWLEASMLCERLIGRDPLDPDVHFLLALTALHRGDAAKAETALKRAIYLDPDFAFAHYHLGMAAAAQNRHEDAVRSFRNVFKSLHHTGEKSKVRSGDGVTAEDLRQYARLQLGELRERAS
jgi:chemotaxis protein methyltransferase CheR